MKFITSVFGLIITVILLLFALSNRQVIDLTFWPFDTLISAPVFILIIGSFLLGFFFSLLIMGLQFFSMSRKIFSLKRQNKLLEEEIFIEKQKRFQDIDQAIDQDLNQKSHRELLT